MLRLAVLAERVVHVDLWSSVLGGIDGAEVVFGATDLADLVRCSDDDVNVVVLDVASNSGSMARIVAGIEARWPSASLVMADDDVDLPTMIARVTHADSDLTMLSPGALRDARNMLRSPAQTSPSHAYPRLTEREKEVLERLSKGNSTSVIASDLRISVNTCRGYLRTLMAKLGVRSQLEVMAYIAEHGFPEEGA